MKQQRMFFFRVMLCCHRGIPMLSYYTSDLQLSLTFLYKDEVHNAILNVNVVYSFLKLFTATSHNNLNNQY